MTCYKMYENIPLLINKTLSRQLEKDTLEHLMECESCRQELAFWIQVSAEQKSYEVELSKSIKNKIYSNIEIKENTMIEATKQAVKIYFKVIKSIL